MTGVQLIARITLGALVTAELAGAAQRFRARQDQFDRASARALALDRRLVVVGAPGAGAHTRLMPAYGCGDVCVDIDGCPACPVSETVDLTRGRTTVPDDSAVVFVSCVLEYVSDPAAAMREIVRMAGDASNVFLVTVQPWAATSVLYPGVVSKVDAQTGAAEPVTAGQQAATVALLAGLAVAAW